MSAPRFALTTIWCRLDNGLWFAEALFCPEFRRLGADPATVARSLLAHAGGALSGVGIDKLFTRRLGPEPPAIETARLTLDPPSGSVAWRGPLPLAFPVLRWAHGHEAVLAYVPALGIEVIATRPDDLDEWLPREVFSALNRLPDGRSLKRLVALQRVRRLVVRPAATVLLQPTIKKRAQEALRRAESRKRSELAAVATRLDTARLDPAYEVAAVVKQLAEALAGRPPQNVLLVGPSGAGKTAAFRELVRRRGDLQLGTATFWATSGAKLVAGQTGFGMWQERCRAVVKEAAQRRAVLHLGSLVELMQVGKSEYQHAGIASFLRPALARGELLAVAECTPEQLPVVEREDPHLLDVFRQVPVPEPDAAAGRRVLEQYALDAPADLSKPLAFGALDALDRLHRRYATGSASPGRPLRFLANLLEDQKAAPEITAAAVLAAFARETGLPRVLLDPAVPLNPDETRAWFAARVLGQPEAVDLVVDLLATVKTGLARPGRPIASLLFIGPTGVGKTELAKALAEFLFGSRRRLTRFDLSEYADPVSVQRLVGGVFGSEGLLTAAVREQPFCVLLLDEFEKAHPLLFDLLLQVLGEGRLTDAAGRLADFRNTVVILTSNLGAETFTPDGFGLAPRSERDAAALKRRARDHFTAEVQAFVRPEFFNRIDRLVPFAPLEADTIRRIADLALDKMRERDGVRYRGVDLKTAESVAALLGRHGFDVRYGARPLQRAVERELLAPLADQMNRYTSETPLDASVTVGAGDGLRIEVKPRTDEQGRILLAGGQDAAKAGLARRATDLRRRHQALERASAVRAMQNELFELERWEADRRKDEARALAREAALRAAGKEVTPADRRRFRRVPFDPLKQTRLDHLRRLARTVADQLVQSAGLEDEALLGLHDQSVFDALDVAQSAAGLEAGFDKLLLDLYCLSFPNANRVTVALFAEDRPALVELAHAYAEVARQAGDRLRLWLYLPPDGPPPAGHPTENKTGAPLWHRDRLLTTEPEWPTVLLRREELLDPDGFFAAPDKQAVGLALELHGTAALPRYGGEDGLHVFTDGRATQKCLAETANLAGAAYVPPPGIVRRGAIGNQERRRLYDRKQAVIDDPQLPARRGPWTGTLAEALGEILRERLRQNLQAMLE